MYIFAETPIHPGSGAGTTGAVDLPIQRERHTEFPIIQGSSLKGVLRNAPKGGGIALSSNCKDCPRKENENVKEICPICGQIFGREEGVGGVSVTDARILAFPVRTLKGVFGWITCPLILERYRRDLSLVGEKADWNLSQLNIKNTEAMICSSSTVKSTFDGKDYVFIEDLQLNAKVEDERLQNIAAKIAKAFPNKDLYKGIKEKLEKDLIVVSDDVFRDLVALTTEVITRIRINPETGTVKTGALWSEEYLPTDTIMYSLILIPKRINNKKSGEITCYLKKYSEKILQVGGDETIGKGFARIRIIGSDESVKEP